jgi:archaeal cell division control protein 6
MEIDWYLTKKEQNLNRKNLTIRDSRVFDFNFIPEKPLMREEVKPVIDAILRYKNTGIANNLLIFGSRGSGKTLLVKYLMQLINNKYGMHFHYANCRFHNTSFKILAHLLGLKARGIGLDELWQHFINKHPGNSVVVLDEVDLFSDKDRNKEILYLMSRAEQNIMVILLSNNPKFLNQLDESIRSTLQPEIIYFRNYTALQIQEILKERAARGLHRFPKADLARIAALTAKNTNSDVRVAIKTVYYDALESQVPLEEHFERARKDIVLDVLNDLNDKNLLILKAALHAKETHVKTIYECYRKLCNQYHEQPFSYMHFYSNLSYLQSMGLLLLIATKIGRAYTNRIQPLFDPEVLEVVWQTRFG